MIKNKINKYLGAITLGMAVLAIPSCTDTWDDHYAELNDPTATKTLWQQIQENPKLTKFKSIAEKANYYRDDIHPVKGYTYADILNSNIAATVWAPEDDAISDAEYEALLAKCDSNGFDVHAHFMSNHIALHRYNLAGDSTSSIKTINEKKMEFDRTNGTFQGYKIGDKNISAVNGVLHTIKGVVPFRYNLYEFIKYGGMTDSVSKYVIARDTTYFVEDASIEGLTNADGNPEYVDSVYFTSNRMLSGSYWPADAVEKKSWLMPEKGFNARLQAEDSTWIMIIPSDEAVRKAHDLLKPFYRYSSNYSDESTYAEGKYTSSDRMTSLDTTAISENNIMMDILTPCVFNLHKQFNASYLSSKYLTMEEFLNGDSAKYYFNTLQDTLRSIGGWSQASLFENATKVEMSNGYAYIVDDWNFPANFYKPNVYVEMTGAWNLWNRDKTLYANDDYAGQHNLNAVKHAPVAANYGAVSNNNFMVVQPAKEANKVTIQIPLYTNNDMCYNPSGEVMSGEYDIYMVRVPQWYANLGTENDSLYFSMEQDELGNDSLAFHTHTIDSVSYLYQNKLGIRIGMNQETSNGEIKWTSSAALDIAYGKKNEGLEIKLWDGTSCKKATDAEEYKINAVDTILIAKGFKFPYTYKNIRSNKTGGRKTFPVLEIKSQASTSDMRGKDNAVLGVKTAYSNAFNIDRIILVSKETGMESTIVVK